MHKMLMRMLLLSVLHAAALFVHAIPEPRREFRGVWIATVNNIDFPTRKGLSADEQKKELIAAVDLASSLNLNAVIFQVRPMADAMYRSKLEPWSEFLTGEIGRPQEFDPLEFLICEAHDRGILVHAWFNPYRAFHPAATTTSADHITKRRPDLVRDYGRFKWMDPTDDEVRAHSLNVIKDVVTRYDIDGVHFDDYFYPYPITEKGLRVDFPDDANWREYRAIAEPFSGPSMRRLPLERDDWRRWNVDRFIEAVGREIKRIKPEIVFGISPFGVAEENYRNLYADAEKWLKSGIVDYFVPQIYWKTERKNREFRSLLGFWESRNPLKRHVWAGLGTYKIGDPKEEFPSSEITDQIALSREIQSSDGNIQFSLKSIRNDLGGIASKLREGAYKDPAIIPEFGWIKSPLPQSPVTGISRTADWVRVRWSGTDPKAFWYVVFASDRNGWSYSIVPAKQRSMALSAKRGIQVVRVKAVDRLGRMSK
jgi:uncharacterized lipoprotein YddW (UPF0748 family)